MNRVNIVERNTTTDLRWRVKWSDGRATVHATAVDALNAVKARDNALVETGVGMAMTVIEWEPRTKVGKAVVSVISKHS